MREILSDDKISSLKGMIGYWNEVYTRENQTVLIQELGQVIDTIGVKNMLFIIEDYVEEYEKIKLL